MDDDRQHEVERAERPPAAGPLLGLKVLDLGQLVAGPMVGTVFADWGADVIKIEQPGVGDSFRRLGSTTGAPLWWKTTGRNKRSIALELGKAEDRDVVLQLARHADVVIENFTPGTMERWGLSYEALSADNPALVMLRVSGYGQTGPYRKRRGFGRAAEAFSGLSSVTGFPDRAPLHAGVPVGDYFAALTGIGSVLAAYVESQRSGAGQEIDLSLYEAGYRLMELIGITYAYEGVAAGRDGSSSPFAAPNGTWQTADGTWVTMSAGAQPMALRVLTAVGGPELAEDPRFSTGPARLQHAEELDAMIAEWIAGQGTQELMERCEREGIVCCQEYEMADIFADPHYRERGSIQAVEDPELGTLHMSGVVPRFVRTPGAIRWAGEDVDASRADVASDPAWGALGFD